MHIIAIGEGFSEGLNEFIKAFNGRTYNNDKCKVRVREIKLLHFGFNENGYDEVLADLKPFMGYSQHKTKTLDVNIDSSDELKSKFQKYIKYIRKLFTGIKSIDDDLDKSPIGDFKSLLEEKGTHFLTTLTPIGKINDPRRSDGREMV